MVALVSQPLTLMNTSLALLFINQRTILLPFSVNFLRLYFLWLDLGLYFGLPSLLSPRS